MKLFRRKKKIIVHNGNKIEHKEYFQGKIEGKSNEIFIKKQNISKIIDINIKGDNNKIFIDTLDNRGHLAISIVGNNNSIKLEENVTIIDSLRIQIFENCQDGEVTIGPNTSFWKTLIQTCDFNSSVKIGKDCMFSYDTRVFNTDGHSIIKNGKLINNASALTISDHVWIGFEAVILKNSYIPKNSIIGYRALVSGKFEKENSIYAGLPAKLVKTCIKWNRKTPNEYCLMFPEDN